MDRNALPSWSVEKSTDLSNWEHIAEILRAYAEDGKDLKKTEKLLDGDKILKLLPQTSLQKEHAHLEDNIKSELQPILSNVAPIVEGMKNQSTFNFDLFESLGELQNFSEKLISDEAVVTRKELRSLQNHFTVCAEAFMERMKERMKSEKKGLAEVYAERTPEEEKLADLITNSINETARLIKRLEEHERKVPDLEKGDMVSVFFREEQKKLIDKRAAFLIRVGTYVHENLSSVDTPAQLLYNILTTRQEFFKGSEKKKGMALYEELLRYDHVIAFYRYLIEKSEKGN